MNLMANFTGQDDNKLHQLTIQSFRLTHTRLEVSPLRTNCQAVAAICYKPHSPQHCSVVVADLAPVDSGLLVAVNYFSTIDMSVCDPVVGRLHAAHNLLAAEGRNMHDLGGWCASSRPGRLAGPLPSMTMVN